MATIKAVIPYLKDDGTARVVIRVTHKRRVRYMPTEMYIIKQDLTKTLNIRNASVKAEVDDMMKRYSRRLLELGERQEGLTAEEIVSYLQRSNAACEDIDFFEYAERYVKRATRAGVESAWQYGVVARRLQAFVGTDKLSINALSTALIRRFLEHLRTSSANKRRTPLQDGTRRRYVQRLRTMFESAKLDYNDEDIGLVRITGNPFARVQLPQKDCPEPRALSLEDVARVMCYRTRDSHTALARDMFTLSFMLLGMNARDIYLCPPISRNGRLEYERKKTRKSRMDKAFISVRIEPEVLPIIEAYKDRTGKRAFDIYTRFEDANTFDIRLNYRMKQIQKSLGIGGWFTFYSARHSFATIAANDCRVNKYTVHEMLNHVDHATKITDLYIKKDFSANDDANRTLLDRLNDCLARMGEHIAIGVQDPLCTDPKAAERR